MKTLLAGWFSFPQMGASAGDLLTRDLACRWLEELSLPYDVAVATPFAGGVDWRHVTASEYNRVLFVCGPFGNGPPVKEMLARFAHCQWIGLNLSMLQPLEEWNPFSLLWERDSSRAIRPDLALLADGPRIPVVGLILIDSQPEYGGRDLHEQANARATDFLRSREVAVVPIDTRLDENRTGLSSPAQVEAMISRVDLVITTRLHGLVLSLKNGIPAVAIDPVAGGAKILRQAQALNWPHVFLTPQLSDEQLSAAFEFGLTEAARGAARACAQKARTALEEIHGEFLTQVPALKLPQATIRPDRP